MIVSRRRKSALTLIEVLIATLIFWIWILTIISVISKNISFIDQIKLKTTASFLAKDSLELLYAHRNTNFLRSAPWNCVAINSSYDCIDYFSANENYRISISLTWSYQISPTTTNFDDNRLYFSTGSTKALNWTPLIDHFLYSYDKTGEITYFSRYLQFQSLYQAPTNSNADTNKVLKVNSVVKYQKWALTWEVVLESIIWNIK